MLQLSVSSKVNAAWDFLSYLHDVGYAAADGWIERNFKLVGRRSSIEAGPVSGPGPEPEPEPDADAEGGPARSAPARRNPARHRDR
ncbi:hypothetical protein [Massilia pseudoviolaceinigra]|uniref:hypothetical protein n=1 Tax=Massilia pseudoviolaceinigra TaxID=3057165 RepID=UPI0027B8B571|nr:hypothetical protein [Massilia sp. CCM 9206]